MWLDKAPFCSGAPWKSINAKGFFCILFLFIYLSIYLFIYLLSFHYVLHTNILV